MARLIEQLTEAKIRTIVNDGLHADGRGLYLQARLDARSWVFRFTLNKRTRDMGLGSLSDVSLMAARAAAAEKRALVAKGIDPIENAASAGVPAANKPGGLTFEQAAERYMETRLGKFRNEMHRKQWRYSLEHFAYPILGQMPVDHIATKHVLQVLRPIWDTRCATASRLRGRIERILALATVEEHRSGANPATWGGHLKEVLPKRSEVQPIVHYAAMDYDDMPAFMADLVSRSETSAVALRFLILTAARTSEVTGALWSEMNWEKRLWAISASRTKINKEHIVPLSTGALETLRAMEPLRGIGCGFVFPGRDGQGLAITTMLALLQRRMNINATGHGFRSTFRDWCGDVAGAPRELAEAALAHTIRNASERSYRRRTAVELRRGLMQRWSDYCLPPRSAEVVDIFAASGKAATAA